jgi:NitT/TauT family transport system substrate-binding protein
MINLKYFIYKMGIIIVIFLNSLLSQAQLSKLVFTPQWLPQAQFAGYYVALDKGFYTEAGIDVKIIHPTTGVTATEILASGKADLISLFLITAMSEKNRGLDIVNIGQTSQHSAILFVTKKTGGIEQLSQLNGKKIGIWKSGFDEVPKALMAEKKYSVEWIPILSTINLFMLGGIDAMTVMSYNEYDQIINSGLNENEVNTFPVADYGFDIPEDGLYCLRSAFENKKGDLKKFMEATLKGWDFAAQNRQYAVDVVINQMQLAHLPANRAHQEWMLNKVLDLMSAGTKQVTRGELLEKDFLKAANILNIGDKPAIKFTFTDFYKPVLK